MQTVHETRQGVPTCKVGFFEGFHGFLTIFAAHATGENESEFLEKSAVVSFILRRWMNWIVEGNHMQAKPQGTTPNVC
jgi:hypothetical protein